MKIILLHCRQYKARITGLSARPRSIRPERIEKVRQACNNCIVVLATIETHDKKTIRADVVKDITEMAEDVGTNRVVLLPFAHLSNNLATSVNAMAMIIEIEKELKGYHVVRSHFGSQKELLLDIFGHPGNVRYRQYETVV